MKLIDLIVFLIPVISVLLYGGLFLREYSTGFIKLAISRTSRKKYATGKVLETAIKSIAIYLIIGGIILIIYTCFIYSIKEKQLLPFAQLLELIFSLIRISLMGAILSVLAGTLSAIFLNAYMTYGLPFVAYYLLIVIKERYLKDMYSIYPPEWIEPQNYWGVGNWGLWVFLLLILATTMIIYKYILEYRIEEIG